MVNWIIEKSDLDNINWNMFPRWLDIMAEEDYIRKATNDEVLIKEWMESDMAYLESIDEDSLY